jgi:hypothetical protein
VCRGFFSGQPTHPDPRSTRAFPHGTGLRRTGYRSLPSSLSARPRRTVQRVRGANP